MPRSLLAVVLAALLVLAGSRTPGAYAAAGGPAGINGLFISAVLNATATDEPMDYFSCQLGVEISPSQAQLLVENAAGLQAAQQAVRVLVWNLTCSEPDLADIAMQLAEQPCSSGGSALGPPVVGTGVPTPSFFTTAGIDADSRLLLASLVYTGNQTVVAPEEAATVACQVLPPLLAGGKMAEVALLAVGFPDAAAAAGSTVGEVEAEVVSGTEYQAARELRNDEGQARQLAYESLLRHKKSKPVTFSAVLVGLQRAPDAPDAAATDANSTTTSVGNSTATVEALEAVTASMDKLAPPGTWLLAFEPVNNPSSGMVYAAAIFPNDSIADPPAAAASLAEAAPSFLNAHLQLPGSSFELSPVRSLAILSGSFPEDEWLEWFNAAIEMEGALTGTACYLECIKPKPSQKCKPRPVCGQIQAGCTRPGGCPSPSPKPKAG